MAYYQYHHLNGVWFKTGIIPNINTRIEVDKAGFHSFNTHSDASDPYGVGWPSLVGSNQSDWDNTKFIIKCAQSNSVWNWGVGSKDASGPSLVFDTFHSVSLDRYYYTMDGVQHSINSTSMSTSDDDLWIGAVNQNGQMFRCGDCYIGDVRIYDNGVLVGEFIPTIQNGEYTYYDTVSQTYLTKYGSGTIVPGPSLEVFEADKYAVDFTYAGGTDTITVTADNSWSCTTPTGFSLSPTSGNPGETTVTVTANHSGTEKAGTATFTDSNSNTFYVELTQSGDGSLFPFAKIIRGTRRIN